MKITHAIYLVDDEATALEFLCELLGFEMVSEDLTIDGKRFVTVSSSGGTGLHLQVVETPFQSRISDLKKSAGVVDFILEVADISSMCKTIRARGMTIVRNPTKAPYGITAIFEDPFGNLWDIVERSVPD